MTAPIQVFGHEWAQQLLRRALQQESTRHAYLFLGPEHIGKTTLARAFAQALTCENRSSETGLGACGQCRSCRLAAEGVHPDHRLVTPAPGKQLLIEQIRDVVREAARSPIESRYKVFIITHFERANANAANALLKTLEEPSATTRILLISHQPSGLLDTIISRCQLLRLRPLPEKQVVSALQTLTSLHEPDARRLARLSNGRLGTALALANDPAAWQAYQERIQAMLALLRATISQRMDAATALEKEALLETILQEWLLWWRDVLILQNHADALIINQEHRAELEHLAAQIAPSQVRRFIEALMKTAEILRRNVNRQLALEALLLKLPIAG
jgi:DNA polymerase-3 subunit delta'